MIAGRAANRLEMLINVSVGGAKNLDKTAEAAKKAAKYFTDVGRTLDQTGVTAKRQLKNLDSFSRKVSEFTQKRTALKEAEKAYAVALSNTDKVTKESQHELAKQYSQIQKLRGQMKGLGGQINELAGSDIVRLNKEISKSTISQKKLGELNKVLEKRYKALAAQIRKAQREQKNSGTSAKKVANDIKEEGKAVEKTSKHWGFFHQRLAANQNAITIFRKSLGAIRNQILVLAFATRGLRSVLKGSIDDAMKTQSALTGLGSVATSTGQGMDAAKKAAQDLADKGLLTVTDAAAGLKNLMATGMSIGQAIKLMNALTNSAAFNRQGTLALGEAVVGATEGIKNQNSIMVDNAGITKNISIMYKEYAAQIGTTAGKLSDAQKYQAIYNGVLHEAQIFAGDANKSLSTLQGTLSVWNARVFKAKSAIGDTLIPAFQKLIEYLTKGAKNTEDYFSQNKTELINKMTKGAEALVQTLRFFSNVASKVAHWTSILFSVNTGLFGQGFTAITKLVVGTKLLNKVMGKVTKGYQKSSSAIAAYNIDLDKQYKTGSVVHNATEKEIKGMEALTLRYHAARVEVAKKNHADKLAAKEITGMRGIYARLKHTMKSGASAATVLTRTVGGLKGAAAAATTVFTELAVAIARALIITAVVQGIIWAVQWFTQAAARARKLREENEKLAKSFEKLDTRITNIKKAAQSSVNTGQTFGFATKGLETQIKRLDALRTAYKNTEKKLQDNTLSEEMRKKYKQALKIQKEVIDKTIQDIIKSEQVIKNDKSKFSKAMTAIDKSYNKVSEKMAQAHHLKQVSDAEDMYDKFLKDLVKFNEHKKELQDYSQKALEIRERKINLTRLQLQKNRQDEIEKLTKQFSSKTLTLKHQLDTRLGKADQDRYHQILSTYKAQEQANRDNLNKVYQDSKKGLTALVELYRKRSQDAKDAVTMASLNFLKNTDIKNLLGTTTGGDNKSLIPIQGTIKSMNYLVKSFNDGKIKLGEFHSGITGLNKTLKAFIKKANDSAYIQKTYGSELSAVTNKATGLVQATEGLVANLSAQADIQGLTGKQLADMKKKYKDLADLIKLVNDQQTKAALSQLAYNKAVKAANELQKQTQYKQKAQAQEQEYNTQVKLVRAQIKQQRGTAAVIDALQGYRDTILKVNLADQKRRLTQQKNLKGLTDQRDAINQQIQAYEDMINKGHMVDGKRVKLTKDQVDAAWEHIKTLYAQKDAVNENIKAYKEFIAIINKLNGVSDDQAKKRALIKGLKQTMYGVTNFAMKYSDAMAKINTDEKIFQDKTKAQLDRGEINHEQYQKLMLAETKYYNAQRKYQRQQELASLIKWIGREIALYAAKKAAKDGNIPEAIALLAAGGAAMFAANKIASNIQSKAEIRWQKAQDLFDRQKQQILNPTNTSNTTQSSGTSSQNLGGTIKADNLSVTISPTVVISGEQVFIGQGSVNEFSNDISQLILKTTQQAIDNRQLNLDSINKVSG